MIPRMISDRWPLALLLALVASSSACGGEKGSTEGATQEAAPNVVKAFAQAMADGNYEEGCEMMTRAGSEQLGLAGVGFAEESASGPREALKMLRALLKRDVDCAYTAAFLLKSDDPSTQNAMVDAKSDEVDDVDIEENGDEATVSTSAGVWTLSELNDRWFVSDVPVWADLAERGAKVE